MIGLLLILGFGLVLPRVVLVACAFFGVFAGVWASPFWPVLGFFFLPYTTLAYGLAHAYGGGVEGGWLIAVIVAVALDLGAGKEAAYDGPRRRKRRRD